MKSVLVDNLDRHREVDVDDVQNPRLIDGCINRDGISRAILDEATNKWGVKVNRVELQTSTASGHQGGDGKANAR